MYFIEILIKKFKNFKKKTFSCEIPRQERENDCEGHVYLPIDSTKEHLACKNCGKVIRK